MTFPWYTDAEIDDLCDGYVTNAAKVKHLKGLGLTVHQKPNGRPLVIRAHAEKVLAGLQQIEDQAAPAAQTGTRPDKAGLLLLFQKKGAAA